MNRDETQLARTERRVQLELVKQLNRAAQQRQPGNAAIEGLIGSHELAFRMQDALPSVLDIESESDTVKKLYGIGDSTTDDFGRQCLMARRMLEAGVRFVEVNHGGRDPPRTLPDNPGKHPSARYGPTPAPFNALLSPGPPHNPPLPCRPPLSVGSRRAVRSQEILDCVARFQQDFRGEDEIGMLENERGCDVESLYERCENWEDYMERRYPEYDSDY